MKFKTLVPIFLALMFTLPGISGTAAQESARDNPLEGDMVYIPPGHFIFGTDQTDEAAEALSLGIPKPWYADEKPEQKVFLKGFYIDRYEVTYRRYKIYVDDVGAIPPPNWKDGGFPPGRDDYPIVWVNWYDAANFCQWAGKKLPTEKQWERAARGTEGLRYPWGNTFRLEYANLSPRAGSQNTLQPVGTHPRGRSPEGVHDLIGNVWEWVEDDYAPYQGGTYTSEYYGQGLKVIRGQSAMDIGHFPGELYPRALRKFARSGYRQFAYPDEPAQDIGFRCVSEKKLPALKKVSAPPGGAGSPSFGGTSGAASGEPPGPASGSDPESASPPEAPIQQAQVSGNPFQAKPNLPQSGFLVLMVLAFIAGLFSFLSPCTLPILPAYFAVTAQSDRTRMGLLSFAFFLGLATLFVGMGASASLLGQILRDYLFSLTTLGGIAVVVFGIMTLMGKGFSGANFRNRPGSTFLGFFLFGATFAMGWTPCVGPVLSGILILAASNKTVLEGMGLLFFFAMGLGLPLILVSTVFGHLPKDSLFWRILRGKAWNIQVAGRTLMLHTTNLFSGLLLIALGAALAGGYLTYINSLIPIDLQLWFADFEEKVLHWFM